MNTENFDDELLFAEESSVDQQKKLRDRKWKILIVDDEEDVHSTTRLVLDDFEFEDGWPC